MKYQDKLTTSICTGAVIALTGNFTNCSLITSAGLGLIASGYIGMAAFSETNEFADLREEFHRRERLYNKF
jgi:hypothetical protein